ncbi:MAG: dihydrofolate reductase [Minisyncoccia bacterium]
MLKIIVAVSENGVIGRGNDLPFNLPADRRRFRDITGSSPVVMGSNTFVSLPDRFRPLPGRENIVLTRNPNAKLDGVTFVLWWKEILHRAETEDMFVIGGAKIYKVALDHCDELYVTRVHAEVEGDVFFPELDMSDWKLLSSEEHAQDEDNEYAFTWEVYERIPRISPQSPFIEMRNCRTDEQVKAMKEILEAGVCPFCPENLARWHKKPILWTGNYWVVSENMWPYAGSKIHLVLFLKTHAEGVEKMPSGAFEELGTILRWASSKYEIPGGGFYMRFGECIWTGGTVRHIHAHIAAKQDLTGEAIRFYLGS